MPVTRQRNLLEMEPKIEYALEWTRLGRDCSSSNWEKQHFCVERALFATYPQETGACRFWKYQVLSSYILPQLLRSILFSPDKFKGLLQAVQEGIIQHTCSLCSLHSKSCPLDSEKKKNNNSSIILVLTLSPSPVCCICHLPRTFISTAGHTHRQQMHFEKWS